MTRTNIDIDDELVAEVMRRHGLKSKKEAVEFALRKAAPKVTAEDIMALHGIDPNISLDMIRPPLRSDDECQSA